MDKKYDYEQLSKVAFNIIVHSGEAKSFAMEAIYEAKKKNFDLAKEKLLLADKEIIEASKQHTDLIQDEAQGIKIDIPLLLMHAEDQLLSTQSLILMAEEIVTLHQTINDLIGKS